jgi:hypothetical protein
VLLVAGGGAAARYRPDLLATLVRAVAPTALPAPGLAPPPVPAGKDMAKEAAPAAPAIVEPAGAAPPAFGERGGRHRP